MPKAYVSSWRRLSDIPEMLELAIHYIRLGHLRRYVNLSAIRHYPIYIMCSLFIEADT